MPRKRHTAEEIIAKLCEVEIRVAVEAYMGASAFRLSRHLRTSRIDERRRLGPPKYKRSIASETEAYRCRETIDPI